MSSNNSGLNDPTPFSDHFEIALRAFVPVNGKASTLRGPQIQPSDWTLVFDTETTVDAAQKIRVGVYQVRKSTELWEKGFFYSEILDNSEIGIIKSFARPRNYEVMTVAEFVENVFYKIGYDLRANIVGFNLPFDISRLAIRHGNSRGRVMKGGFSLQLSPHKYWPNIQIKNLSPRASLIRFTTRPGRIAARGMRKRKFKLPPRPGYFVDLKTLAAALTSRSFTLAGLADFLKTDHRKLDAGGHGRPIGDNYLVYAAQDVQVTWECYCELLKRFRRHNFTDAQPHRIFSEASIGKAYFREMNIRPWREMQPDFPNGLTGIIVSTYYGGRAEVHHRRMISRVLYTDFLSMYPTVCTLMGLWRYVTATGINWRDSTLEVRQLLETVTPQVLQDRHFWPCLTVLVQVMPDEDVFPVRGNYGEGDQLTIGLNKLTHREPMWFTFADCIASTLRTGKPPKVIQAIAFEPRERQSGLKPVEILGNPDYRIDPYQDDFYRRVIDLRTSIKGTIPTASADDRAALESAQLTLKILANATSYGNFVELNVEDLSKSQRRECFGFREEPFTITTGKSEGPGAYFHPLIATLITGAARLMLAITEKLILDNSLDWAFCDTDSMAIAKPAEMDEATLLEKVGQIRHWFGGLNPYSTPQPLLKLEDANFSVLDRRTTKNLETLYCWAISTKRYALFNFGNDGKIIIRKASAHGLGHMLPPYEETQAPTAIPSPIIELAQIGVERWQYDLWHQIIRAAIDGHLDRVDLNYHPNLEFSAASRYSASTPPLLKWFAKYNFGRDYSEQIRPSNFMLAFQVAPARVYEFPELTSELNGISVAPKLVRIPKPVAAYGRDSNVESKQCFDRDTGLPIPPGVLKTYREALGQYHLRPEQKFLNGNFTDFGITRPRHVVPTAIRQIGKESNRWAELQILGSDERAEIDYGVAPEDWMKLRGSLPARIRKFGQRRLARLSGISRKTISVIVAGKNVRREIVALVDQTIRLRA